MHLESRDFISKQIPNLFDFGVENRIYIGDEILVVLHSDLKKDNSLSISEAE